MEDLKEERVVATCHPLGLYPKKVQNEEHHMQQKQIIPIDY
jgi:hypothetical protein